MNQYIAGEWKLQNSGTPSQYKYFMPNLLPEITTFVDETIPKLLEEANQHLGELNSFANFVPDVDFFITMHEAKEATQSNAIEGTQTNFDEAVLKIEDVDPERRDDWQEVQNYIKATRFAINSLDTRPLATNLLKDIHRELLQGVRGEHKTPGEFRWSQNWIGGSSIKDAKFIPPAANHINDLLNDFDNYLNNRGSNTPHLIKIALLHYQFETIHPFLDGNGRLGRVLIVLYLMENKKLTKPILYLSDYFARHKSAYYEALEMVREQNDIEHWIKFFLVAVSEMSKESCTILTKITELKTNDTAKVITLGKRSELANHLLSSLYSRPIINSKDAAELLEVSQQTAITLLNEMQKLGILSEITGFSRNRMFAYSEYIRLFSKGTGENRGDLDEH